MAGKKYVRAQSRARKGADLRISGQALGNVRFARTIDDDGLRPAFVDPPLNGPATVDKVNPADDAATNRSLPQAIDAVCVADRHDGVRGASAADLNRCARVIANPEIPLADRAACAGAEPGQTLESGAATAALGLIARSARDLFGSIRAADVFLKGTNFDDTGLNAKTLISHGRGTAVIARLDELRYGTQG